ncbi:MAG: hypothetical protein HY996_02705 [Micrococcales bacterium]|nr:hypothetical protein [Micrococcales bacterium]
MTNRPSPAPAAHPVAVALAVLLLLAAGAALGAGFALEEQVRRLMRDPGTDTTIFTRIGQTSLTAEHVESIAAPLATGAAVALVIALVLPRLRAASVVRLDLRILAALPALGTVLIALGGVAAAEYARRQTVIGTLTDPGAEAALVPSAELSSALVTAGGVAVMVWLCLLATAGRAGRARRLAPWAAVAALLAAGIVLLQLRIGGYVRMQGLYAGFYAATPDPRVAGREIVALQSRDLLYSIVGTSLFAAASVGVALAVAARAFRSRLSVSLR